VGLAEVLEHHGLSIRAGVVAERLVVLGDCTVMLAKVALDIVASLSDASDDPVWGWTDQRWRWIG
jgi:hypothetical protein